MLGAHNLVRTLTIGKILKVGTSQVTGHQSTGERTLFHFKLNKTVSAVSNPCLRWYTSDLCVSSERRGPPNCAFMATASKTCRLHRLGAQQDLIDVEGFCNLLTGFNKEFIQNNVGNYYKI